MGKLINDGLTCQQRYVKRHPARVRASCRKWRRENPEKWRIIKAISSLKRLYGDEAPAHKAKQLKKQKGRCAICRKKILKRPCLDHKGKVLRGVLCLACNLGVGFFRDSRPTLRRAISYLRKWGF